MGLGPHITALVLQRGIFEEIVLRHRKGNLTHTHTNMLCVCVCVCVYVCSVPLEIRVTQKASTSSGFTSVVDTQKTGCRFAGSSPILHMI